MKPKVWIGLFKPSHEVLPVTCVDQHVSEAVAVKAQARQIFAGVVPLIPIDMVNVKRGIFIGDAANLAPARSLFPALARHGMTAVKALVSRDHQRIVNTLPHMNLRMFGQVHVQRAAVAA